MMLIKQHIFIKTIFQKIIRIVHCFVFLQIFLMSDNRKQLNLHICFLIQSSVVRFCEVNEENPLHKQDNFIALCNN